MEETLKRKVADLMMEAVRDADLRAVFFNRDCMTWGPFSRDQLQLLFDSGCLSKKTVLQALEAKLRKDARTCLKNCITRKEYIDQASLPEAVAYALRVGEFKGKEVDTIPFDVEMTPSNFISHYHGEDDWPKMLLVKMLV